MHVLEFSAAMALVSLVAGFLGSLTGLGGGVVITPALVLLFGVDFHYAMGATLVSVIATSSGAAAAYVREGLSNIRLAMFLEMATTIGAVGGAATAPHVSTRLLSMVFGSMLLYSAWMSSRQKHEEAPETGAGGGSRLRLAGTYFTNGRSHPYAAQHIAGGFAMMAGAGLISGLLGIGSGAFKVLAMDRVMRIPFKVSTATSNFMIGVTAAASAGVYWRRGYVEPGLVMPVMLGVLAGSMLGARHLPGASMRTLRIVFGLVVGALGLEMIYRGLNGRI